MRKCDDEGPISLVSRQQLRVLLKADAQTMYLLSTSHKIWIRKIETLEYLFEGKAWFLMISCA